MARFSATVRHSPSKSQPTIRKRLTATGMRSSGMAARKASAVGVRTAAALFWQITPRALTEALAAGGAEAKRTFEAMMTMTKIDIATIEAVRRSSHHHRTGDP